MKRKRESREAPDWSVALRLSVILLCLLFACSIAISGLVASDRCRDAGYETAVSEWTRHGVCAYCVQRVPGEFMVWEW